MASRPLRIVKFRPQPAPAEQQAAPATALKGILRSSEALPKPRVTFSDNNTMRTLPTPAVSRETLLQQITEIRTGLAEIQEIAEQIDAKLNHDQARQIAS